MDAKIITAIITALIAVSGVVLSAGVSILVDWLTTRRELAKARRELTSTYAGKLLEVRLKVYPELYAALSDFIKHIEGGSEKYLAGQALTISDVQNLLTVIVAWDSKHALVLSDRAGRAIFDLRQHLVELITQRQSTREEAIAELETLDGLLGAAQEVELALKVDLGIYEVELYEGRAPLDSYQKASEAIKHKVKM